MHDKTIELLNDKTIVLDRMDLITTHMNADFDALGSMVAARKLYPGARLLLPGSQEESVREFLLLAKDEIPVETERECRIDDVDRLVLVDTRHKTRIGIAAELVEKGIEIHIYDHHPRMKDDVRADMEIYEEVGATVTILADIIRKRRVKLSHLEATLMLLGIYEETGSLTYRITTPLDVDMVSFLLSQGASLPVVSSYLNRELSEAELSLLTKLISSTEKITVKGASASFIEMESENYSGELGILLQKLQDIENISVLFVLIRHPKGRVDVIARSRLASVDMNRILSRFGGGGHPGAASAKINDTDADSVKRKLIAMLRSGIKVRLRAKDIMSSPARRLTPNTRVDEARRILLKDRLGGMPVVEKGRVAGIITMNHLNKAIKRGFGHSRIKGYMSRSLVRIGPDMPMHAIREIAADHDTGVMPVTKGKRLIGVINRTDLLRNIHASMYTKPPRIEKKVVLNLSKKMEALLPRKIMALLKKTGRTADTLGCSAFVVGGVVRDLMLGVKNLDLDIVVEADAIRLGRLLSQQLPGTLVIHKRFGTCTVVTGDSTKIDIATARKEVYEKPAALPTVEFSSLKEDLIRRDFTINAMAMSLSGGSFGQLIDFFGGERDLARGRIRVMHDKSFIDDPTRIFRAVRFEQRLGFAIDGHTEELIRSAIYDEMIEKLEPQRIRDELILILKEDRPLRALKRMAELDELRFIHPKIRLTDGIMKLYGAVHEACAWFDASDFKKRQIDKWLIYLMALLGPLSYNEISALCGRFVFRRGERLRMLAYKTDGAKALRILSSRRSLKPSRIYSLLEPLPYEVILLMMAGAKGSVARERIKLFFRRIHGARIHIKGDDLRAMGLKPCPKFKSILRRVLYEKIDGRLKTRKDELEYAGRLVGGKVPGVTGNG